MKGFIDDLGRDRPPCAKCRYNGCLTVEAPCYNCVAIIDLALQNPNYKTEFAAFTPKEE